MCAGIEHDENECLTRCCIRGGIVNVAVQSEDFGVGGNEVEETSVTCGHVAPLALAFTLALFCTLLKVLHGV